MSKSGSGYFKGTNGSTAHIWNDISATQSNYSGTVLPKSFTLQTSKGNYWIHGNATKHMHEDLSSGKGSHAQDPQLYTQLMLADFQSSVNKAISSSKHLQWVDENGKTITIEYTRKIEQFQPNGASLSEGNYKGTIVYTSKSEYLLWWDAVPIE